MKLLWLLAIFGGQQRLRRRQQERRDGAVALHEDQEAPRGAVAAVLGLAGAAVLAAGSFAFNYAVQQFVQSRNRTLMRQHMEQIRKDWELSTGTKLSVILAAKGETAEWLNMLVQSLWKEYIVDVAAVAGEAKLNAKLQQRLDASKSAKEQGLSTPVPTFITALECLKCYLGSAAPNFRNFKTSGMSDQHDGDVFLDCDMDFITSDMDVTILATIICPTLLMPILGRTAKVFVKVINMRMSMRIRVRIRPKEKLVFIGIIEPPQAQLGIIVQARIGNRKFDRNQRRVNLAVTDLPGVKEMLESLLQDELVETFQWPRFYPVQLSSSVHNPVAPPTGGMLNVQVVEARDLLWSKDVVEETTFLTPQQVGYVRSFDDWQPFQHPVGMGTFVSSSKNLRKSTGLRDDLAVLATRKLLTHGLFSCSIFRCSAGEMRAMNIKPKNVSPLEFAGVEGADLRYLHVRVVQGRGLMAKDRGGTSDPYYQVFSTYDGVEKELCRSRIIQKTVNPVWKDEHRLSIEPREEFLVLRVFDYDFGTRNDFLGQITFDLAHLRRDARKRLRKRGGPSTDDAFSEIWYQLEGRSQKSTVTGSIQVALEYDIGDEALQAAVGEPDYLICHAHCLKGLQNLSRNEKFITCPDGTMISTDGRKLRPRCIGKRKCPLTKARDGISDPYVLLELGDHTLRSTTHFDNCNPELDELFAFSLAPGAVLDFSELKLTVWDFNDPFDVDECMGRVNLSLTDVAASPAATQQVWCKVNAPPKKQQVSCNILFGSPAKQKDTAPTVSTSDKATWITAGSSPDAAVKATSSVGMTKDGSFKKGTAETTKLASFDCPLTDYDDMFNFTLKSRQERMLASGSLKLLWNEDTRGVIYAYSDTAGNPETVYVLPGAPPVEVWLPMQQDPYSHRFCGRLLLRLRCTWNQSASMGPMIPPKDVDWNNLESVKAYYERLKAKQNASVLKIQRRWKMYCKMGTRGNIGRRLVDATKQGFDKGMDRIGNIVVTAVGKTKGEPGFDAKQVALPPPEEEVKRSQSVHVSPSSSSHDSLVKDSSEGYDQLDGDGQNVLTGVYERSKSVPVQVPRLQLLDEDDTPSAKASSKMDNTDIVAVTAQPKTGQRSSGQRRWMSCFSSSTASTQV